MKNIISEIKTTVDWLNDRLDTAEERFRTLRVKVKEITQNLAQPEMKNTKIESKMEN